MRDTAVVRAHWNRLASSYERRQALIERWIATLRRVPDPLLGLRKPARVVKPGGRILVLKHVRIDRPVIGGLMDLLDPLFVRLNGSHINRRTVENVRRAGLAVHVLDAFGPMGVVRLIEVRAG